MAEQPLGSLHVYDGWQKYQQQLIAAIEPLTAEQLALRPAPQLRSIGELASHIIGVRAGWLYYNLQRGGDMLRQVAEASWQPDRPTPTAADLIAGLQTTWQVIEDTLNQWTVSDLAELVKDTDENDQEYTVTRQWVIWHLLEHDMHHGGEISFTLGIFGVGGIDMRYTNHG